MEINGFMNRTAKNEPCIPGRSVLAAVRFVLLAWLATGGAPADGFAETSPRPPNVVLIITDDQGYQDVGCYGSPLIQTPNLDQMAESGRRFTSYYAAFSTCSPSRAGLLAGRYPQKIGVLDVFWPDDEDGLPLSETTLADLLRKRGYATAFIGKWHLGHLPAYLPTARGFDSFFGLPYSNDMSLNPEHTKPSPDIVWREGKTKEDYDQWDPRAPAPRPPLMRGTECIEWPVDQDTLTQRFTQEAVAFIQQNRGNPFFLLYAPTMPHTPIHVSEAFRGKSKRGRYGDAIEEIDWSVGELLRTLRAEGLEDRTVVFFTSDNGPALWMGSEDAGSAGSLRGGKASCYEGGFKVPFIAQWPGTIPAGTVCGEMVSALDIFPTLAALSGADLPSDPAPDGNNILPLLTGTAGAESPERSFFYGLEAVRVGDWKYRQGRLFPGEEETAGNPFVVQLFNLEDDPGETDNLAGQHPEKLQTLKANLDAFAGSYSRPERNRP